MRRRAPTLRPSALRVVRALVLRSLLALAAFGAALPGPAPAQEAAVPKSPILTLDQERLFTGSRFGKALLARHQADVDALLAENRRIEAALEAEELDLTERRARLPAEEFQALATAFDTKAEDIRTDQNAKDRVLTQRLDQERQRFYETAAPVLADILREAGAMAIIDKRAVVLSFDAIDMTDAAIARLDAMLGDGSAPEAAPAGATPEP